MKSTIQKNETQQKSNVKSNNSTRIINTTLSNWNNHIIPLFMKLNIPIPREKKGISFKILVSQLNYKARLSLLCIVAESLGLKFYNNKTTKQLEVGLLESYDSNKITSTLESLLLKLNNKKQQNSEKVEKLD